MILKRFVFAAALVGCLPGIAFSQSKGDKTNGNPIVAGWYADPEGIIYGDSCSVYPTLSFLYGAVLGVSYAFFSVW
ncbi:glycosyl hydrolase family 43 [Bacteroides sp. CAG:443]|nr:glycosyl hydrolase family 43 [Bacteroides sp. CAG:443]